LFQIQPEEICIQLQDLFLTGCSRAERSVSVNASLEPELFPPDTDHYYPMTLNPGTYSFTLKAISAAGIGPSVVAKNILIEVSLGYSDAPFKSSTIDHEDGRNCPTPHFVAILNLVSFISFDCAVHSWVQLKAQKRSHCSQMNSVSILVDFDWCNDLKRTDLKPS
jgi:hypothetical protein